MSGNTKEKSVIMEKRQRWPLNDLLGELKDWSSFQFGGKHEILEQWYTGTNPFKEERIFQSQKNVYEIFLETLRKFKVFYMDRVCIPLWYQWRLV